MAGAGRDMEEYLRTKDGGLGLTGMGGMGRHYSRRRKGYWRGDWDSFRWKRWHDNRLIVHLGGVELTPERGELVSKKKKYGGRKALNRAYRRVASNMGKGG